MEFQCASPYNWNYDLPSTTVFTVWISKLGEKMGHKPKKDKIKFALYLD